ncbi:Hypothetical predicted protein [Mytilus galloprovincialis]|uniref:Peptidase A2 domain-containing protein n=1 Tax=Mytilus galloprovincialis TaxID=29158 RepID=A0A8B6DXT7_MYTGA|nr:Hypothetical predicted protein [Mytilus galloprovincialis]
MEEYKPFMSDGFVSIVDDTTLQPIKILRDTGASQSLLLEGVLPLSENTSVGASVLLQGVEIGCIDVPFHRIYLKAMARKQQDEDLQEDQFDYIDLSDTFLADIEDPVRSEKAILRPPSVNKNVIMPG